MAVSWRPSGDVPIEAERSVVVGKITHERTIVERPGLRELLAQLLGGGDVGGVGDGHVAGPHPGVVGDQPAVAADPDPFQIRRHGDVSADHRRVDGVVVGVDPDVVVAAEADLVRPTDRRRDLGV